METRFHIVRFLCWFVATAAVYIILQQNGWGFAGINPIPRQLIVSESGDLKEDVPEMVFAKGGLFSIGDPTGAAYSAVPVRQIKVDDFFISRYEITFNQFDSFCRYSGLPLPPDEGYGRGDRPVVNVNWNDAVSYCNWLSRHEGLDECYQLPSDSAEAPLPVHCNYRKNGYRLPTEAEWEYAARGGVHHRGLMYAGSDIADDVAWYFDNSGRHPKEAGRKLPNELGLYDMSGNAYELTGSYLTGNYSELTDGDVNPSGPKTGSSIAIRGGSCFFDSWGCRVWYRKGLNPSRLHPYIGFRIVRREGS
ncbi:MAG: SUMF1/EgtB/PvdO family nonheme iron enzyme [Spirochaetales bacterium]|nr:SUMF1/EgtB/PvdO family nonheme iron enzyme [Spirochaetales bacterium]